MTNEPAIHLRDVCVRYGDVEALHHVNLDIAEGEFVGIVGPNGGGKSTLVRAAIGLAPLSCGEARLFGTPATRLRDHHRIAYVPQNVVHVDARFPITALEVALLGRTPRRGLFRRLTEEDHRIARESLKEVGVADRAGRRIGELSGGERQRVFLAKALASEPEVLLLDEPTTGVDPGARESFYRLLDHLNHEHGMTLVLVSHDTQAIALSAHRLVAVNRTIVFDGAPAAFERAGGFAEAYGFHLDHGATPHGPEGAQP